MPSFASPLSVKNFPPAAKLVGFKCPVVTIQNKLFPPSPDGWARAHSCNAQPVHLTRLPRKPRDADLPVVLLGTYSYLIDDPARQCPP